MIQIIILLLLSIFLVNFSDPEEDLSFSHVIEEDKVKGTNKIPTAIENDAYVQLNTSKFDYELCRDPVMKEYRLSDRIPDGLKQELHRKRFALDYSFLLCSLLFICLSCRSISNYGQSTL